MKTYHRSGIGGLLLLVSAGALPDQTAGVQPTADWNAEAAQARRLGTPILMLFTDKDCGYCERLKKEVLEPLVARGEVGGSANIRELDIDRGGKIRDFDGEKIRTRAFVKRYGIYATPTLTLVDYEGKPMGTPIVGFDNRQDYLAYLEYFLDVAYWEPQKLAPAREERFSEEASTENKLRDWELVTQVGGSGPLVPVRQSGR